MHLLYLLAEKGSRQRPSRKKVHWKKYSSEMMKKGQHARSLLAETNEIILKKRDLIRENCVLDLIVKLYCYEGTTFIPGLTKMIHELFCSNPKITCYLLALLPTHSLSTSFLQGEVFFEGCSFGESYQQDCAETSRYNIPHL